MSKKSNDGTSVILILGAIGAVFGLLWSLRKYPIQTIIGANIITLIYFPENFENIFIPSFIFVLFYGLIITFPSVSKRREHTKIEKQKQEAEKKERQKIDQKNELVKHVSISIPDELAQTRDQISRAQVEAGEKFGTKFQATRPFWRRVEFIAYKNNHKKSTSGQMYVDDVNKILSPNSVIWSETEKELLADKCKYPVSFPEKHRASFEEFPFYTLS